MQWTREGAHNVLQIRAMMASNEWEENWLDFVLPDDVVAAEELHFLIRICNASTEALLQRDNFFLILSEVST